MLFPFCKFKKIATFEQVSCGNFASSSDRWRYTWAEDERLTMSGFFPCDFYEGGGGGATARYGAEEPLQHSIHDLKLPSPLFSGLPPFIEQTFWTVTFAPKDWEV